MTKQINKLPDCCIEIEQNPDRKGFLWGILYGLVPHTFCILFVILSVVGATSGAVFFKKFLFVPHLFQYLLVLSFILATISAVLYLKRNGIMTAKGIQRKWKYLTILYSTTIIVNLLFVYWILPAAADTNQPKDNLVQNDTNKNTNNTEIQVIRMDQYAGGYSPSSFTVKKGVLVRWVITSHKDTCAASINSSKLGIQKILDSGENVIEFTPKETGKFKFTCIMGMYSGGINVIN